MIDYTKKYQSSITPTEYRKLMLFTPFLLLFIVLGLIITFPIFVILNTFRFLKWLLTKEVASLEVRIE